MRRTPWTAGRTWPGRGRTLGGGTWEIHTEYGGGVDITIGPGSVAAHGSVVAFEEAHRRDGRLPWRQVVAPALDVAGGGFRLSAASRYYLEYVHDSIFGWDDASRTAVHDAQGDLVTDLIVVPDLADSLELIATEGAAALHTGDLARLISSDVLTRGGLLGPDDLAAYAPVTHPSLATRVGDWTLATTPPPSAGGVSVATMLDLLEGRPRSAWTDDDIELLIRVQREVLGRGPASLLESGSTAHCSATDTDGGACAVTVSSGYFSGMIAEGTGIWLNNTLGVPTTQWPHRIGGLPSIAVPQDLSVSMTERVSALVVDGRQLSDHDAYVVEVARELAPT